MAVREVFVAGRKVVAGGRIVSIDRDAVMAEIAAHLSAPETAAQTHARTMAAALAAGLETLMRHDAAQT